MLILRRGPTPRPAKTRLRAWSQQCSAAVDQRSFTLGHLQHRVLFRCTACPSERQHLALLDLLYPQMHLCLLATVEFLDEVLLHAKAKERTAQHAHKRDGALGDRGHLGWAEEQVAQLVQSANLNRDGVIDADEWVRVLRAAELIDEKFT